MVKTFWGWRDEQLRDGNLIFTSPVGDRYVTHPGSALIFPDLGIPTAPITTTPTQPTVCEEDLDYDDTLPIAHDTRPPTLLAAVGKTLRNLQGVICMAWSATVIRAA